MRTSGEGEFRDWAVGARPRLRRTAFLLCGDWYLADDLVQDVLLRMYRVWPRDPRFFDPTAYARRVLVNRFVDHRRSPGRLLPRDGLRYRLRQTETWLSLSEVNGASVQSA